MSNDLTQDEVRKLFSYDPLTGKLTRLVKCGYRPAGMEAGYVHVGDHGKSYRRVKIQGITYLAHRVIWLWVTGTFPTAIDHEDGNGLNNAWTNLAAATDLSNMKNVRKKRSNTSGHVGVIYRPKKDRWIAQIQHNNKQIHLGYFANLDDAISARKAAQEKYRFHPNHGQDRPL